jgi:DsbC/DsbD-like thiol-disulfide interchange protein
MNARSRTTLLGLSLIAAAWVPVTAADDFGAGNVRARLVADTDHIAPGGDFHLGVRFEIKPGWHIYWRNPGGAGLATDIRWQLPEGVQVGDLQWPLPIGFAQSEGIPGYGYEGTVVVASRMHAASDFIPALSTVGAEVSWLACKGVCVLGSARLEGKLAELIRDFDFRAWRENLPRAADDGQKPPFSVTATGGLAEGALSLWLRWRHPPGSVEWFPDPVEALEVGEAKVETRGGLTRIDAVVRSRAGSVATPASLAWLVVAIDAEGNRRGWELAVDLTE